MSGLGVDVTIGPSIDLPSATGLVPGDYLCLFAIKFPVFPKAPNDNLAPYSYEVVGVMLADGLDPVLFESPFSASRYDVVLLCDLPQLPDLEFAYVIGQFGYLVEGIISVAGLDSDAFFEFGGLGRALAT